MKLNWSFSGFLYAIVMLLTWSVTASADMAELSDNNMGKVTGQDGIALQVDFHLNTGNDGLPLSTLVQAGDPSGCTSPMQSGSFTLASTPNPCHMAIQANRPNNPNLWLVFKDMYGYFNIPTLYLNNVLNPSTATAYADPTRFQNTQGHCLLPVSSSACSATGLAQGLPTFALSFQNASGTGTFSDNINLFLNIGRVSIEFGSSGYNNDSYGSFMGLRVSDLGGGTNPAAKINLDGQVRVYGF